MDKNRLQQLLENEKRQPNIDLLEEGQRNRYQVLNEIYLSHKMLSDSSVLLNMDRLDELGYNGKKIINEIRNIVHWYRDISLHEELVREPVEIFLANNSLIIKDLDVDLLAGKLVIRLDTEKEFGEAIFSRSFFVHYTSARLLQLGDFCYSNQVDDLAVEIFLENVLGDSPDLSFLKSIEWGGLHHFVADFFNNDRGDFPEIMAFVIVDRQISNG